ncbi:hypothetical protein H2248_010973 [Termitomyces sp. 'cryptogamus']|nr:hypothetical protein H2248_010973 [Termitomyces sp. 'cryptogamus']
MASVLGLTEADLSTVVVTFVPGKLPTRLDISSINLTVTGDPATSIFLPSMTLPPTASLPIFSPALSSPPSPVEASDHHMLVVEAVGITIGLSLGLTVVAVLGYLYWRRRRRRRPPEDCEGEATSQPSHALPTSQSQTTSTVVRASRVFGPHTHKKNQREKSWFP